MLDGEEMVHDFEPLRTGRVVDTTNVHDLLIARIRMLLEEMNHGNDGGGSDVKRQLILVNRSLLNEFRQG